jgi:hypothetical protein
MKTIIDFIKKHYITIIIVSVLTFIAISSTVSKCTFERIAEDLRQTELNTLRRSLTDSLKQEQAKKEILLIDSLNAIREAERAVSNKKVVQLLLDNNKLKTELKKAYDNLKDSSTIENCLDVVEIQKEVINKQDTIINVQSNQVESYKLTVKDLNDKYDIQYKETLRTRMMYNDCQNDVEILVKRLEKQNTWYKKNEKWIYLGIGVVTTLIITK